MKGTTRVFFQWTIQVRWFHQLLYKKKRFIVLPLYAQKHHPWNSHVPAISRTLNFKTINPAIRLLLDWADIGQPQSCISISTATPKNFIRGCMTYGVSKSDWPSKQQVTTLSFDFHWDPGTGHPRSIPEVMSPKNSFRISSFCAQNKAGGFFGDGPVWKWSSFGGEVGYWSDHQPRKVIVTNYQKGTTKSEVEGIWIICLLDLNWCESIRPRLWSSGNELSWIDTGRKTKNPKLQQLDMSTCS